MIQKFMAEFEKFSNCEEVENLSGEAMVALFGTYCEAMANKATPAPKAQIKTQSRRSKSSDDGASKKQFGFIKALIKTGDLEDCDIGALSRVEASRMIDKGLKTRKERERIEAEVVEAEIDEDEHQEEEEKEEKEESFTGGFNHQSGGLASQGGFFN